MSEPIRIGRYTLHDEIASGGMARVYFGRMAGAVGFTKVVAIKRMHAHFTADPDFRVMFLDEATLAARITHPNVVGLLDVVEEGPEILIVMEYVRGESLSALMRTARRRTERIPVPVAVAVMVGALAGLHAAHEARSEEGEPLGIVHRDVSPHNLLVGLDGMPRITDFGVAKAIGRAQITHGDTIKGKLAYMSPERLSDGGKQPIDRRADVFSAGVVLWEILAGERLFAGDDTASLIAQVLAAEVPPLRSRREDVPHVLEEVIRKALARQPADRFASAEHFAIALEAAAPTIASWRAVGEWVRGMAAEVLGRREARVAEIERPERNRELARPPCSDPGASAEQRAGPPPVGTGVGESSQPSAPIAASSYSAAGSLALTTPPAGRRVDSRMILLGSAVVASIAGIALGAAVWFGSSSGSPAGGAPSTAPPGASATAVEPAPPPPPAPEAAEETPPATSSSGSVAPATRLVPSGRVRAGPPQKPSAEAAAAPKPKAPAAPAKPAKPQGAYLPDSP